MFIGNWLLAFSWDCTFAIEHVHGHHKDVCLDEDPASAKRGENIYFFILRATFQEQISGWKIESERLERRNHNLFSIHNRMVIGYFRSLSITVAAFIFGGIIGMLSFLLCALLAKFLLESINYIEHYGLVRERGTPVKMRHSWNSNHLLSSIYLCNVTRHSDHHISASLKFWELHPCHEDAPLLPYGYLSMLYLLLVTPFIYKKIMAKEFINWDQNYANDYERNYVMQWFRTGPFDRVGSVLGGWTSIVLLHNILRGLRKLSYFMVARKQIESIVFHNKRRMIWNIFLFISSARNKRKGFGWPLVTYPNRFVWR